MRARYLLLLPFAFACDCSKAPGVTICPLDGTPVEGCVPASSTCPPLEMSVENEGWKHVAAGSAITPANNPPASGNHYPVWAKYQAYDKIVPRGYWIHNVEHGAVIFLYKTGTDPEKVTSLQTVFDKLPNDALCGKPRAVLTEDPELPTELALVAADHVLYASCVDETVMLKFVSDYQGKGPEAVCVDGTYVPE
ncbi:MAG: DUF3105 domain-containing protein [Myxococcaceae bacterium]